LLDRAAFGAGLSGDDYVQQATLTHRLPISRSPLGAYNAVENPAEVAVLRDRGLFPWWVADSTVAVHARPFSSLLLWVDHALGLSPLGQHVHGWLWWALGVLGIGALAFRVTGRVAASITTLVYAAAPAHAIPLCWIANRTAHVSAAFGAFALWALVGYTKSGRGKDAALALSLMSLALLAGEYALGYCALGAGLLLVPSPRRIKALAGLGGLVAVTFALRAVAGIGVRGNGMYIDPLLQPLHFLSNLAIQLPALFVQAFVLVPSEGTVTLGRLGGAVVIVQLWIVAGIVAAVLVALGRGGPERALAMPVVVGTALSIAPFCAVDPSVRLLVVPMAGASLAIGIALSGAWSRLRRPGFLRFAAAIGGIGLGLVQFVWAPYATYRIARAWAASQAVGRHFLFDTDFSGKLASVEHVIVLRTNDLVAMYYAPYMLAVRDGHLPKSWRALSATREPILVRRLDERTLEISALEGNLFDALVAKMIPVAPPLRRAGGSVETPDVRVTVLAAPERPTRVRFDFRHSLDAAHTLLLDGNGDALVTVELPAPGGVFTLPPAGKDPDVLAPSQQNQ
ncbi:MAG: hypothetical protein KC776_30470, partial [Myxococcales bacterium]|nr:hypothetical protein [Myxococcales bacterium]